MSKLDIDNENQNLNADHRFIKKGFVLQMGTAVAQKNVSFLKDRLAQKHLKLTKQRETILDAFLKNDHITAEGLYEQLSVAHIHLGLATIYRTLNLLCTLGICEERHFGDSKTTFDNILHKKHHDHLICRKCKKIIEFECLDIEKLQEKMAKKFGFILEEHKLELYGYCKDCNLKKRI